jgi:hypothetical protein
MKHIKPWEGHRAAMARNLGVLGTLVALSACSEAIGEAPERTGSVKETLLATSCSISSGNLVLTIKDKEVGYVGLVAGCTAEPCVFANALDASGAMCKINSTGKSITVNKTGPSGTEKMVIDCVEARDRVCGHLRHELRDRPLPPVGPMFSL